jgi:outer membrane immunogenic protein
MRKVLLTGAAAGALLAAGVAVPARAADLGVQPAPAPAYVAPVPVFTWTGLYIGANAGAAWGEFGYDVFFPSPALFGNFSSGRSGASFIGGGQIGFNWQFNQFVFGIEGDIDGKSLSVTNAFTDPGAPFASLEGRARVEGSVRARGGIAFDRLLVYATGGWAVTDVRVTGCAAGGCVSDDQALNGYTVGGGVEFALTNNVSLGVEYRFSDFGRESFELGTVNGVGVTTNADLREHQVTGRLNFKFGGLFQP